MAESARDLLDPSTLARIENYGLLARVAVNGFVSGMHRSLSHGFGTEFLHYRNYSPGEDLKYVDWKVYARNERLYTKVFEEETNMNLYLLVDLSASMDFQGTRAMCSKSHYAKMLAACLAHLAIRQGDHVGLIAYGDDLFDVIEPSARGGHLDRILRSLQRIRPAGASDHLRPIHFLERHLRSRGLVVVISDMLESEDVLPAELKRLRTARSDCIALQVLDPDELDLPRTAAARMIDAESSAARMTSPEAVSERYNHRMAAWTAELQTRMRRAGVDHCILNTRDSIGISLARYLSHHANTR